MDKVIVVGTLERDLMNQQSYPIRCGHKIRGICLAVLAITLSMPFASATRYAPPTSEELIAGCDWIFTGILLATRMIHKEGGVILVHTVHTGLVLRGEVPKKVVVTSYPDLWPGIENGKRYIFFVHREALPEGGTDKVNFGRMQPIAQLKEIEKLVPAERARTAPAAAVVAAEAPLPLAAVAEAQRKAIERYPSLGIAGSPFHTKYMARYKLYQETRPDFFRDSTWPLRLADELARPSGSQ